jgi:hypothetical protein
LENNLYGDFNTAVGFASLGNNLTGSNNTAVGDEALVTNTYGGNNTSVGDLSLLNSTTASHIIAVGYQGLATNTTGAYNTTLGTNAFNNNTYGNYNTGLGDGTVVGNTTGQYLTALGYDAGSNNTTGQYNTAVGYEALLAIQVQNGNTAAGWEAHWRSVVVGNTGVGWDAGNITTTGTNNTSLGYNAGPSASGLTNATAIGANASVAASNTIVLGNGTSVAIGTTSVTIAGAVQVQVVGSMCVKSNGNACAGSVAGNIYTTAAAIGSGDLAENMPVTDQTLSAGEVVAIGNTEASSESIYVRATEAYQENAVGVVSTQPGLLMGSDTEASRPVALAGRVPVNVTLEGGAIRIGDYLAASSTPGKAMRAKETIRGGIIGIALSSYDGTPVPAKDWEDGIAHERGDQVLMLIQLGAGGQARLAAIKAEWDRGIDRLKNKNRMLRARAAVVETQMLALKSRLCQDGQAELCGGGQ